MTATLFASLVLSALLVGFLTRGSHPLVRIEAFPSMARRRVALVLLVVTIALACVAPLLQYPETDPHAEIGELKFGMLFLGHLLLVLFLAAWWGLAGFPAPTRFLEIGQTPFRDTLRRGIAAGATSWAIAMTLMAIVGTLSMAVGAEAASSEGEIPPLVRAIVELPIAARLLLVVSAGVVEEAFFRAFLQSRSGLLVSSLLFTASHTSYGLPLMLVGVFAVSIVFGLVFRARQDVIPCMIAHGVFDAIQLFVILPAVVAGS